MTCFFLSMSFSTLGCKRVTITQCLHTLQVIVLRCRLLFPSWYESRVSLSWSGVELVMLHRPFSITRSYTFILYSILRFFYVRSQQHLPFYPSLSFVVSVSAVAVVSILLYGCTTWALTKRVEKKLDGNYTRMLRAILNKSWWQHPTKH